MPENQIRTAFGDDDCLRDDTVLDLASRKRLYVVFIIARSGSTWLTEQARLSGVLGTPQEHLNESFVHGEKAALGCEPPGVLGMRDVNTYLEYVAETHCSRDGLVGLELSRWQTSWLGEMLESPGLIWKHMVPFYLRRENIVAQAVSLSRSIQSGIFHASQIRTADNDNTYESTRYDEAALRELCSYLLENEQWFEAFFTKQAIIPRRFTYEDMLEDMDSILQWMRGEIAGSGEYSDIKTLPGEIRLMGNHRNSEWEQRFRTENRDFLRNLEQERPKL